MSPASYLLFFVLLAGVVTGVYLAYALRQFKSHWRIVRVCPLRRGPNADSHYNVAVHQGREVWLTDEQLLAGKVRATSLASQPHTFE